MNYNFLNIIILLGAIQGFILSALLYFIRKNNQQANRLLAVLILIIALACFNLYLQQSGLYNSYQAILLVVELLPFVIVMAFGPIIYFYVKSVTDPSFRLSRKHRIHFVPVIFDLAPHIIVWVFFIGMLMGVFTNKSGAGWGDFIDEYNAYSDIPRWISITVYSWIAKRELDTHYKMNSGAIESVDYKWLNSFLKVFIAFQTLWLAFLIPYIIPQFRYPWLDLVGWYPLYIPMAVMVYWLGIKGYFRALSIMDKKNRITFSIPLDSIKKTVTLLTRAMNDDKLYLDASLSVNSLSKRIGVPQKTISAVLNQHLNSSFNEFVNKYRVNEVKKRLLEPANKHLTITGIAFECGFNSQATFQRAFKQLTNISPSEFLARHTSLGSSEKISA